MIFLKKNTSPKDEKSSLDVSTILEKYEEKPIMSAPEAPTPVVV